MSPTQKLYLTHDVLRSLIPTYCRPVNVGDGCPSPHPTLASTTTLCGNLCTKTATSQNERASKQAHGGVPSRARRTKIPFLLARTPTALPHFALGAMRERVMFVSHLPEEVNFVFAREERRGDRVHGCVTPALSHAQKKKSKRQFESVLFAIEERRWREDAPRNRSRRCDRGSRRTRCRPLRAINSYRRSQSC